MSAAAQARAGRDRAAPGSAVAREGSVKWKGLSVFSFRQQQCSARLNQKESPNGKKGKTTASEQLGKGRKEITTEESSKQANRKQTSPRSSSPKEKKRSQNKHPLPFAAPNCLLYYGKENCFDWRCILWFWFYALFRFLRWQTVMDSKNVPSNARTKLVF